MPDQHPLIADPLVWGTGPRVIEIFLEPTCPFCARTFSKLDALLAHAGPEAIQVRLWMHARPWHMRSGITTRAILAASAGPDGKDAAKRVMAAIFDNRAEFDFDDHCGGPQMDVTPAQIVARIEELSGVAVAEAFQNPDLTKEVKAHTRYSRQNGIHVSPTFLVDGFIDNSMSSGDSVKEWVARF